MTRDHPRLRGEHKLPGRVEGASTGSSPPTRGARAVEAILVDPSGIIPAYAGSTALYAARMARMSDHPRLRGEHHWTRSTQWSSVGSSPPTRGARCQARRPGDDAGIIPAYAGSTARALSTAGHGVDHPRLRGEHLTPVLVDLGRKGSSPPTRGARPAPFRGVVFGRIIPAYAGSTTVRFAVISGWPDHPRLRGEHNLRMRCGFTPAGSSPPTRGARSLKS